jgi:hypothetical protein
MRPGLGTSVPGAIYDSPETATATITKEVETAFANQLPLLKLQSVNTSFNEYTGIMTVNIVYDLPNNEQVNVNIGLATVQGNAPITQEIS